MRYEPRHCRGANRHQQKSSYTLGEENDEKLPPVLFENIATKLGPNHKANDTQCEHCKGPESLNGSWGYQVKDITQEYSDYNTADNLRNAEFLKKTCAERAAQNNQAE
jgi:hypothetical protein